MAKATTTKPKSAKLGSVSFGKELVLGALIAELLGTFILTFAVMNTGGNAIIAAVTVLVMVLALAKLSGGHINPAVTIAMLATKQISWVKAAGYIVAQVLGAMLAYVVVMKFVGNKEVLDQALMSVREAVAGDWKPVFAEFLGSILFGLGIAAAVLTKKEGFDAAFTVGGSLLLGLVAATIGSSAILNPAVAIGMGAFKGDMTVAVVAYAIAPVVGLSLGAWLYKLLQSDVDRAANK